MERTIAYTTRFGNDPGTLHVNNDAVSLAEERPDGWTWRSRRRLRRRLRYRPIVWFVDDELANREWFAKAHRRRFGVVTFSDPDHATAELENGAPCDVIVTDIFFPATPPASQDDEEALMSIYETIKHTMQKDLESLWITQKVRERWQLKGFRLAQDVTALAKQRKERIPILLFSRKAPMLLSAHDWSQGVPHDVEDTFWMIEKVEPTAKGLDHDKVQGVQAVRIRAAVRYRVAATPLWKRLVKGIKIEIPVTLSASVIS